MIRHATLPTTITSRIRYAAARAVTVANQLGQPCLRAHRPIGSTAMVSTRASIDGAMIPAAALMPMPAATTPRVPSSTTIERGSVVVAPPVPVAERIRPRLRCHDVTVAPACLPNGARQVRRRSVTVGQTHRPCAAKGTRRADRRNRRSPVTLWTTDRPLKIHPPPLVRNGSRQSSGVRPSAPVRPRDDDEHPDEDRHHASDSAVVTRDPPLGQDEARHESVGQQHRGDDGHDDGAGGQRCVEEGQDEVVLECASARR